MIDRDEHAYFDAQAPSILDLRPNVRAITHGADDASSVPGSAGQFPAVPLRYDDMTGLVSVEFIASGNVYSSFA
jgi:hypothetical protein